MTHNVSSIITITAEDLVFLDSLYEIAPLRVKRRRVSADIHVLLRTVLGYPEKESRMRRFPYVNR